MSNALTPSSGNARSESVATLNPANALREGATYEVVVVGGSGGVKAKDGGALAQNKSWSFTVGGGGCQIGCE